MISDFTTCNQFLLIEKRKMNCHLFKSLDSTTDFIYYYRFNLSICLLQISSQYLYLNSEI